MGQPRAFLYSRRGIAENVAPVRAGMVDSTAIRTLGDCMPVPEPAQVSGLSNVELMFAGSMAGALSKCATAPLDRVKILYQGDSTQTTNPMIICRAEHTHVS